MKFRLLQIGRGKEFWRETAVIDTISRMCYTFPMRKVAKSKNPTLITPPRTVI